MLINDINILQNKFHRLLEIFLNGEAFSKKAKILYPLNKSIDFDKIRILINEINEILDIKITPKTNKELAIYISNIYQKLQILELPKTLDEKNIKCKYEYSKEKYKNSKANIINCLVEYLKSRKFFEYLDLFLIHGSYSTMDYKDNISDLDTLILIKDTTLLNYKKLLKLQTIIYDSFDYFYEIDLLQHHGYFVLTHFDVNYYNETFFPTILFDYSTSVFSSKNFFKFKIRNYELEKKEILNNTLNYIESTNPNSLDTLMHYKLYFQIIQLIPIAYLQYLGKHIYKKYSFELFLEDFPQYKNFFTKIYEMRLNWKQNNIKKYKFISFLKNRHIYFLNSKLEKVSNEKFSNLGENEYKNILKPMINDIRNKLKGFNDENI